MAKKKANSAAKAKTVAPASKAGGKTKVATRKTPDPGAAGAGAGASRIRVRMYRQGLGDCFLLGFPKPKPDEGEFFILIDCGVILGTPRADDLMKAVVEDIAETTDKHIDVLVATHEHWDHVSGFDPGKDWFKDFRIDKAWLAWTEDPDDATAQKLRHERAQKLAALWLGFGTLQDRIQTMLPAASAAPPGGPDDPEREELKEALAGVERAAQVLSFFGIDPETDPPPQADGFGAAAAAAVSKTAAAMTWIRKVTKDPKFCKPGDLIELPEAGGVRAYVLGPPSDLPQLLKDLPTRSGRETYDELRAQPAAAERAFFADGGQQGLQPGFNPSLPFDQKYQIGRDDAQTTDFFRDHYFGSGASDDKAWRCIEGDWTGGAARFALQLDSDTNNTSLALAFELPDGRVLLFPGDAQVGNWESWHADPEGKKRVWRVGRREVTAEPSLNRAEIEAPAKDRPGLREVTAEQLLNRTVLYKVGHHGSHNATLREKGLEMMTDKNLAAMVPVDIFIAHEKKRWMKMPFNPLMSRLAEVTRGRVLQADRAIALPAGGQAGQPAPWPESPTDFPALVSDSAKQIDVVVDNQGNTAKRPLYVEYLL
jgi:hypothetical protein